MSAEQFHRDWYHSGTWKKVRWRGVRALKCPFDLWIYQELITSLKPGLIIECGTNHGGTTLFLADMCSLNRCGRILSIDNVNRQTPRHPKITYLHGGSTTNKIVSKVKREVQHTRGNILVILDSDHRKDHVLSELDAYSKFVTTGSYLIVEDTNLNNPVDWPHGAGPAEAVAEWLPRHPEFEVDASMEKFQLTFNPGGYLKCVR